MLFEYLEGSDHLNSFGLIGRWMSETIRLRIRPIKSDCSHLLFYTGCPIKRLQDCGGIAQPNEKKTQQIIVCSKGKLQLRD